jgi:hypothetical protein
MKTRVVRYFNQQVGWLYGIQAADHWVSKDVPPPEHYWRQVAGNLSESCAIEAAKALATLDAVPDYYQPVDVVAWFGP